MILLDNSIIFTALPTIRTAMHCSAIGLAWVQDAYTLVFGGLLLLLGARAGDLLGRRRVFIFGVAVFALASLLVGVAPTGWWLIGARAVQGIGAAVVAPSSLSLLTASFPPGPRRAKAVALYGTTAGIGAGLGLVIGGALADWVSWRADFFLNVPIGVAMILLAPPLLARDGPTAGTIRPDRRRLRHPWRRSAGFRRRLLRQRELDLAGHRRRAGRRAGAAGGAGHCRTPRGPAHHAAEPVR
jgi:MFS family permease